MDSINVSAWLLTALPDSRKNAVSPEFELTFVLPRFPERKYVLGEEKNQLPWTGSFWLHFTFNQPINLFAINTVRNQ